MSFTKDQQSEILYPWYSQIDWKRISRVAIKLNEFKRAGEQAKAVRYLKSQLAQLEKMSQPTELCSAIALSCIAWQTYQAAAVKVDLPDLGQGG